MKTKEEYAQQFGKWIEPDEIVFDVDDREKGFKAINFIGIELCRANYYFQIWYCEGGKSPHLHVKNIKGLEDLESEQLRKYKKLFIKKYTPQEYLKFIDVQICGKHRIAEENKPHYKYKTIKKLLGVWNGDKQNHIEMDLYEEAKQEEKIEVSIDPSAIELKDKLKITDIAKKYGLKIRGKMAICPWHDDKSPSLSLSDEKGVFNCFGCNASGDLITFVRMLEDLKNAK